MAEKHVSQERRTSMDEGAIKELLESEAFVNAMRQILGLKKDEYRACDLCQETETEVRRLSPEDFPNLEQEKSVHYCPSCDRIVNSPLQKERWTEREHSVMSRSGVEMYISNVRGLADKIIFTSDFSDNQITRIMEDYHATLAEELYQNWGSYDIDSVAEAKKIVGLTTDLIWGGFNRAKGGKTLEGVVNMGDDRTVKKSETGSSDSGGLLNLGG